MYVNSTDFKQQFGHYSKLIKGGTVKAINVTQRGTVVGIYSKPKRSELIPSLEIETKDLVFDREEINER